jgi:Protein of unknown function (DUF2842)
MTLRARKLAGTIGTVLFLVLYSLLAMALGGEFVIGSGGLPELIFYIAAGIAWLPFVMLIIRWMSRAEPEN